MARDTSASRAFILARRCGIQTTPVEKIEPEDIELAYMVLEDNLDAEGNVLPSTISNVLWNQTDWDIMYIMGARSGAFQQHTEQLLADGSVEAAVRGMSEAEMYRYLYDTPSLHSFRFRLMRKLTGGDEWWENVFPLQNSAS